jgi:dephospho-CoA kinase
MKIIGITGKIGSGKDAVSKYLVKEHGFKSISIGDLVRDKAKKQDVILSRTNLSKISKKFTDKFGLDYWSECAVLKIKKMKGDKFVVNGIRRYEDYKQISKSFKSFKFYMVDTKPKTRFERMKKRSRPGDPKTYDQFKKQEKNEYKLYTNFKRTLKQVDDKIDNNKSLNNLHKNIKSIL